MDQQQLDDACDQLVYAPNRDQLAKRRLANSAAARARIGEPLRFAYGSAPIEALDVCQPRENKTGAGDASAPVAVFVLGGAWRTGAAFEFTFLAEPFVRAAPISRCFGGDRERLYLISHSSGSHLAGLRRDTRLGERGITPRHSRGRDAVEWDVRSCAGAAFQTI